MGSKLKVHYNAAMVKKKKRRFHLNTSLPRKARSFVAAGQRLQLNNLSKRLFSLSLFTFSPKRLFLLLAIY